MQDPSSTLEIVSERATLAKREVVTGKVRVETRTEHHDELVTAALRSEAVDVERVPVNREVDEAPAIRTEGDVTIVPIVEEILIVEKRLVLKEELHIRRTVSHETVETSIDLREQHAVIERLDVANPTCEEET
ncbi:YsnF/AvaK domain-containing protein [Devosia sediminis]|uniref:YsnF/AvaK domain-containing protein n=1 Tax=Devosia sediminis TaxID=2798801 RepID=A0A934MT13_9HYPH|nr:YsnF/AvaK domain-containing protein [Devosia sediminis]MBJ3786994.1 YsnF/AvaK domain-containing protein [Devosia sediminis]